MNWIKNSTFKSNFFFFLVESSKRTIDSTKEAVNGVN